MTAVVTVAMGIATCDVSFGMDSTRPGNGDGGSAQGAPVPQQPTTEPYWYKVRVVLDTFAVKSFNDGLDGVFTDTNAELYGTFTTTRAGAYSGHDKSIGLISNRYLRQVYRGGSVTWWVGQGDFVDTSKINQIKADPNSAFADYWKLTDSSTEYGKPDELALEASVELGYTPTNFEREKLCDGRVGVQLMRDPACRKNNNVIEMWILTGGTAPHQGGQVAYDLMDYDSNASIIGAPDDKACVDRVTFGISQAELNAKLNSGRITTVAHTSPSKSDYDGRCELKFHYTVLEKQSVGSMGDDGSE